jgi:hypothetical protein
VRAKTCADRTALSLAAAESVAVRVKVWALRTAESDAAAESVAVRLKVWKLGAGTARMNWSLFG